MFFSFSHNVIHLVNKYYMYMVVRTVKAAVAPEFMKIQQERKPKPCLLNLYKNKCPHHFLIILQFLEALILIGNYKLVMPFN